MFGAESAKTSSDRRLGLRVGIVVAVLTLAAVVAMKSVSRNDDMAGIREAISSATDSMDLNMNGVASDSTTSLTWQGKQLTKGLQSSPTFAWLKNRIESKGCEGLNMLFEQRSQSGYMTDLSCQVDANSVTVEGRGVPAWWVNTPVNMRATVHSDNTVTCNTIQIGYDGASATQTFRTAVCMLKNGPPATPTPTHYDVRRFSFSEEQGDWVTNLQTKQLDGLSLSSSLTGSVFYLARDTVGTVPRVMVKSANKVVTFSTNPSYWQNNGDRPLLLRGEYIRDDGSLVALTIQAGWSSSTGYKYKLEACWIDDVSKTGALLTRKAIGVNAALEPIALFGGAKCDAATIQIII